MPKKPNLPRTASIAVTYRCNARCVMCDIWKKPVKKEVSSRLYQKLPSSLKMIDITGGEPFLRNDLLDIIKVIDKKCPRAKILITSNGSLFSLIKKVTPKILAIKPNLSIRISLDGWKQTHNKIRGRSFFNKTRKSIMFLRKFKNIDLGIIFTLQKQNVNQLDKMIQFCQKNSLNISLNIVHSSSIFYGLGKKLSLRLDYRMSQRAIKKLVDYLRSSFSLKNWIKSWFYLKQLEYLKTGKRPLACGAARDFFFLDPYGKIYACHIKDWLLGDLNKKNFSSIWNSTKRQEIASKSYFCHDCWIMCTAKDAILRNKIKVLKDLITF